MASSDGLEGPAAWPCRVALRRDGGIEAARNGDAAMNFTPKKKPAPVVEKKEGFFDQFKLPDVAAEFEIAQAPRNRC